MRDRLKATMADIFSCESHDIPNDADLTTLDGWDSLRHLELMLELEAQFGLSIPTDAMVELISLPSIEQYLHEHGVGCERAGMRSSDPVDRPHGDYRR